MIEPQRAVSLVYDLLKADAGAGGVNTLTSGRIYRDVVPQTAALPSVTVGLTSAVDISTTGGRRVFQQILVDVRVIGDGSGYQNAIADRIDAVLQNAGGLKDGVQVVEWRREQVRAFLEDDAGRLYAHLIQTYRTESYAA